MAQPKKSGGGSYNQGGGNFGGRGGQRNDAPRNDRPQPSSFGGVQQRSYDQRDTRNEDRGYNQRDTNRGGYDNNRGSGGYNSDRGYNQRDNDRGYNQRDNGDRGYNRDGGDRGYNRDSNRGYNNDRDDRGYNNRSSYNNDRDGGRGYGGSSYNDRRRDTNQTTRYGGSGGSYGNRDSYGGRGGGYNRDGNRGYNQGGQGGQRRPPRNDAHNAHTGRNFHPARDGKKEEFKEEFDFTKAAEEFTKQEGDSKEAEKIKEGEKKYSKASSFFDKISCETTERLGKAQTKPTREDRDQANKLDAETFGRDAVSQGHRMRGRGGRGRYRGHY